MELRRVIVEINEANQEMRGRYDDVAIGKKARHAERLEGILAELRTLTEWKRV